MWSQEGNTITFLVASLEKYNTSGETDTSRTMVLIVEEGKRQVKELNSHLTTLDYTRMGDVKWGPPDRRCDQSSDGLLGGISSLQAQKNPGKSHPPSQIHGHT